MNLTDGAGTIRELHRSAGADGTEGEENRPGWPWPISLRNAFGHGVIRMADSERGLRYQAQTIIERHGKRRLDTKIS
jgi:hypothetical protein